MDYEISNAKITGVTLSMGHHGCLTFDLHLESNKFCVAFGGYCIGHGYLGADHFDGSPKGLEAMMRIMDTVGVERWEDLEGKYIRYKDYGWGSGVEEIGNIIENKWFNIKEFFKEKE